MPDCKNKKGQDPACYALDIDSNKKGPPPPEEYEEDPVRWNLSSFKSYLEDPVPCPDPTVPQLQLIKIRDDVYQMQIGNFLFQFDEVVARGMKTFLDHHIKTE